jgi:hypothetical protein
MSDSGGDGECQRCAGESDKAHLFPPDVGCDLGRARPRRSSQAKSASKSRIFIFWLCIKYFMFISSAVIGMALLYVGATIPTPFEFGSNNVREIVAASTHRAPARESGVEQGMDSASYLQA